MDDQNKNLILAVALSLVVILGWTLLFPPPDEPPAPTPATETAETTTGTATTAPPATGSPAAPGDDAAASVTDPVPAEAPRLQIDTPRVTGSISLTGGRIDRLELKDYRETLDDGAPIVTLLRPAGTAGGYYALHGWTAGGGLTPDQVPGADTPWEIEDGETLTPETPVTLVWSNDAGLTFRRTLEIDEDYTIGITQSVENTGETEARVAPYGLIVREGKPADLKGFFILFEGAIRQADGTLEETTYDNMTELDADPRWGATSEVVEVQENGWIGFTDHYWETILIPSPGQPFTAVTRYGASTDVYSTWAQLPTQTVAAGETAEVKTYLYAGAKEWEAIQGVEERLGVERFVDSIDWGWFYFLTKPIFRVLHWLNGVIGNMGWAIIILTFLIKAVLFPLAYKSYVSMARMKELQPEMEKLREKAGDDRQKLQQEMMKLYKEKKVNPAAGCLPILLQIPIFFSLYKVIFVTLELRHAPWIGWIDDLSAPDPSSIFNLFGLLPWAAPEPGTLLALIFIGLMPILLGISMWLQQKLNPAPPDPTQAMIFAWMPWVFMFMLGSFASGLVLYWITNNTITFIQQYTIMRSHGAKPDVLGNIRGGFKRRADADRKDTAKAANANAPKTGTKPGGSKPTGRK